MILCLKNIFQNVRMSVTFKGFLSNVKQDLLTNTFGLFDNDHPVSGCFLCARSIAQINEEIEMTKLIH